MIKNKMENHNDYEEKKGNDEKPKPHTHRHHNDSDNLLPMLNPVFCNGCLSLIKLGQV